RRRPQRNSNTFGRAGGRSPRHVIGDELQHCCGRFRQTAGNWNERPAAAADRSHKPKNLLQRDTFAAENVAMSDLPAFHGKDQTGCDVAYIEGVPDEIKIKLKASPQKWRGLRRW